jgi:hypothetical protein
VDGVRTAVAIWMATLCAPLTGLLVGGPAHAWPGTLMVAVLAVYAFIVPVFFERTGLRGWAWCSTKGVGLVPAAWVGAWWGLPHPFAWVDALPFLGAAMGVVLVGTGAVAGTALGRSFLRWTWLPAVDSDTLVRERFAAACWERGVEPVDLERTLSIGGDGVRLAFVHAADGQDSALVAAKDATERSIQTAHRGRLWPAHWHNTTQSPDVGGSIHLHMALARGEGLLTALQASAHERMAVLARHNHKGM